VAFGLSAAAAASALAASALMVTSVAPAGSAESGEAAEAVAPLAASAASAAADETGGATWPDESAEAAFLADARERGEPVVATKTADEVPEENDSKALPPLHELVERIPAEVRETLEELFRARFVNVKRMPKKALKT